MGEVDELVRMAKKLMSRGYEVSLDFSEGECRLRAGKSVLGRLIEVSARRGTYRIIEDTRSFRFSKPDEMLKKLDELEEEMKAEKREFRRFYRAVKKIAEELGLEVYKSAYSKMVHLLTPESADTDTDRIEITVKGELSKGGKDLSIVCCSAPTYPRFSLVSCTIRELRETIKMLVDTKTVRSMMVLVYEMFLDKWDIRMKKSRVVAKKGKLKYVHNLTSNTWTLETPKGVHTGKGVPSYAEILQHL